ncbi:unnamed protein product, partial [Prorocentrum cordatum]
SMPERPFLLAGARFEFRGQSAPNCTELDVYYDPRDMAGQFPSTTQDSDACQQRCKSV